MLAILNQNVLKLEKQQLKKVLLDIKNIKMSLWLRQDKNTRDIKRIDVLIKQSKTGLKPVFILSINVMQGDVRSLMVMNGYYVITCDKVLIKANEILPIGLI